MKTYQKSNVKLPQKPKLTGLESARFHDGMLVSADDLEAATRYPVSLLQAVLRAYFGCGVVCGLGLRVKRTLKGEPVWAVCVERGMAVDCQGYPIELVAPIELDLSPDACACEAPSSKVWIAIRRVTSQEAAHDPCSCADDSPSSNCGRVRDQVLVKAFTQDDLDALPGAVCRREPAASQEQEGVTTGTRGWREEPGGPAGWCETLECATCACDGPWVLLGSVTLDAEKGLVGTTDTSERRWVKPVAALCALAPIPDLADRVTDLEEKVRRLSETAAGTTTTAL